MLKFTPDDVRKKSDRELRALFNRARSAAAALSLSAEFNALQISLRHIEDEMTRRGLRL